jgi:PIN domain nuclease of toxin-antitoxin system
MLVTRGRIAFDRDVAEWVKIALALPKVWLAPVLPEIALVAAALGGGFPGDPADRLIAATAQHHRAALVTKDRRIRNSRALSVIW